MDGGPGRTREGEASAAGTLASDQAMYRQLGDWGPLPDAKAGPAELLLDPMELDVSEFDESIKALPLESTDIDHSGSFSSDLLLPTFTTALREGEGFGLAGTAAPAPPGLDSVAAGIPATLPFVVEEEPSVPEAELAGSGASAPATSMSDAELADVLGLPAVEGPVSQHGPWRTDLVLKMELPDATATVNRKDECRICRDAVPAGHRHFSRCGHGNLICAGCADRVLSCPWCREVKDGVTKADLEAERVRLDAHGLDCTCSTDCSSHHALRAPPAMEARLRDIVASFSAAGAAAGPHGRDAAADHVRTVLGREFGAAALELHSASLSATLCRLWPSDVAEAKPDPAAAPAPAGSAMRGAAKSGSGAAGGKTPPKSSSKLPNFSTKPRTEFGGLSDYDIFSYDLPDLLALGKVRGVDQAKLRAQRKRLQNRAHAKASVDRKARAKDTLGTENAELRAENTQLREAASALVEQVQALTLSLSATGSAGDAGVPATLAAALARVTGVLARK